MKKSFLALILAFVMIPFICVSVSAETIKNLSFTTPMELQKYKQNGEVSPWDMHTGWGSDNGVLQTDEYIEYCYAVRVESEQKGLYYHPEEIDVKCTYDGIISYVSEFDKDSWIKYFRHYEISNDNAQISSAKEEKHGGVEYFRIDCTLNGIKEIVLFAPAANGEMYSFTYRYKPSTGIAQYYEQDFWDVIDTVSLKQNTSSAPSGNTSSSNPPADDKQGWGGKTTTTFDDGTVIVEYTGDDAVKIYINNERIKPDTNPVIVNGRTLVPIRAIAEKMGYSVNWFEESRTVSMQKGSDLIQLSIGSESLYHNSTNIIIDVVPMIYEDRTYLPVRAVSEAMGADVSWDGATNTVYIEK